MRRSPLTLLSLPSLLLLLGGEAQSAVLIDLESGRVSSGYNDVRIPGDTGTEISLTDDLSTGADPFFRGRIGYQWGDRHALSVLYAPLTLEARGTNARPLSFRDVEFPAGTNLHADYTFNSYRLTYRYTLRPEGRFRAGIGFTAKIRDAVVRVEGDGQVAEKTNVGFVPLFHFQLSWHLSPRFSLLLDGDALAAPQGRAEDVQIAARFDAHDRLRLRAGYRLLEGGADNETVYNFTLANYLLAGVTLVL